MTIIKHFWQAYPKPRICKVICFKKKYLRLHIPISNVLEISKLPEGLDRGFMLIIIGHLLFNYDFLVSSAGLTETHKNQGQIPV